MNKMAAVDRSKSKQIEVCPCCAQPMPGAMMRAVFSATDVVVDTEKRKVWWRGAEIRVTKTEIRLMAMLVSRPGAARHRETLLDAAFGMGSENDARCIDSHMKRLRRKFERRDPNFRSLETVHSIGYRWKDDQGATR